MSWAPVATGGISSTAIGVVSLDTGCPSRRAGDLVEAGAAAEGVAEGRVMQEDCKDVREGAPRRKVAAVRRQCDGRRRGWLRGRVRERRASAIRGEDDAYSGIGCRGLEGAVLGRFAAARRLGLKGRGE